jgi:glycosyltransferase involved in cell wall biosynthesis
MKVEKKNPEISSNSSNFLSVVIPTTEYETNRRNISELILKAGSINADVVLVLDSCGEKDFEDAKKLSESLNVKVRVVTTNCRNPGGARNSGLQHCRSKWIVFWDSDDDPVQNALLEMINEAEENACSIAIGGYREVIVNSSFDFYKHGKSSAKLNERNWQFEVGVSPGLWRFAFKFEFLKDIEFPDLRMGEDQVFLQRVFHEIRNLYFSEETVYKYHIGSASQLTAGNKNLDDLKSAIIFGNRELRCVDRRYRRLARIMLIRQCITLIVFCKCTGRQYLRYSFYLLGYLLRDVPTSIRMAIRILGNAFKNRLRGINA